MQEYGSVVVETLPLMLSQETKGRASVIIASYMNAMLRSVKTEDDLRIFAQTLTQCKDFSQQNNLGGLNKACVEWNHEGLIKLNELHGISNLQIMQNNDSEVVQKIQQFLKQTWSEINVTGMIDTDNFQVVAHKLNQIEASLISTGSQYLSQDQIQHFIQEIDIQREQLKINSAMIDEILDDSHLTR